MALDPLIAEAKQRMRRRRSSPSCSRSRSPYWGSLCCLRCVLLPVDRRKRARSVPPYALEISGSWCLMASTATRFAAPSESQWCSVTSSPTSPCQRTSTRRICGRPWAAHELFRQTALRSSSRYAAWGLWPTCCMRLTLGQPPGKASLKSGAVGYRFGELRSHNGDYRVGYWSGTEFCDGLRAPRSAPATSSPSRSPRIPRGCCWARAADRGGETADAPAPFARGTPDRACRFWRWVCRSCCVLPPGDPAYRTRSHPRYARETSGFRFPGVSATTSSMATSGAGVIGHVLTDFRVPADWMIGECGCRQHAPSVGECPGWYYAIKKHNFGPPPTGSRSNSTRLHGLWGHPRPHQSTAPAAQPQQPWEEARIEAAHRAIARASSFSTTRHMTSCTGSAETPPPTIAMLCCRRSDRSGPRASSLGACRRRR